MSKASQWLKTKDFPRHDLVLPLGQFGKAYPLMFHDHVDYGIRSEDGERVSFSQEEAVKIARHILDIFGEP